MNLKFYKIYQFVAFLIIFPLAFYLWNLELNDLKLVYIVLGLPVLTSYIIPYLGINYAKFWEFDTNFKIKNIRFYHGFVFGGATSLFGLMFYKISPVYTNLLNSIFFALVCGAFIAFWNTVYDLYAVIYKFIKINNYAAYNNKSEYEAVLDYAPPYFYSLGFIYALFLKYIQYSISTPNIKEFNLAAIGFYIISLILPTLIYALFHYKKYKLFGIMGYRKK